MMKIIKCDKCEKPIVVGMKAYDLNGKIYCSHKCYADATSSMVRITDELVEMYGKEFTEYNIVTYRGETASVEVFREDSGRMLTISDGDKFILAEQKPTNSYSVIITNDGEWVCESDSDIFKQFVIEEDDCK